VITIEFCSKCGGLIIPHKKGKKTVLICRSCGKKSTTSKKLNLKVTTATKKENKKTIVVEKKQKFEVLPETKAECPRCGNNKAFWWMLQTRAGDEPATRFYRCTKCRHTWREYE